MSCRSTPAGSAWTTFARLESGLTDVQTLSAFHALRAEGRGIPAPSEGEWARFVTAQRIEMEAAGFTEARVRSLNSRLDRAAGQTPDGASWYALRNIRARTVAESNGVVTEIAALARTSGEDVAALTARYEERLAEVERGRNVRAPEGYEAARTSLRTRGLPADHGTFQVLAAMRAEAEATAGAETDRPRRVALVEFANSKAIFSAGYDPDGGRLEVVFRRRDREGNTTGTSRTYAYQGVPTTVWARMCGEEGPGHVYNSMIRNHNEYRYSSIEEEEAAAHRRCDDCGQWWGPTHACPSLIQVATEAVVEPVVVSQTADGRARLVSAVAASRPEDVSVAGPSAVEAEVIASLRAALAGEPAGEPADVPEYEEHYDTDYYDEDVDGSGVGVEAMGPNPLLVGLGDDAGVVGPTAEETEAAIADLRARLTGSPAAGSRETAQARIVEAIPDPVRAVDAGIYLDSVNRFGHLPHSEMFSIGTEVGRYDNLALPEMMGMLWETAATQPVVFNANWNGRRANGSGTGWRRGTFRVSGEMVYSRVGGVDTLTARELQCSCADYETDYTCEHVDQAVSVYREAIDARTGGLGRGFNADLPPVGEGAVPLRRLSIPVEATHLRGYDYSNPSINDSVLRARRLADVRSAAQDRPVLMPVRWAGNRNQESTDGLPPGPFVVTGQMQYARPGRGRHEFTGRHLQCTCEQYREEYRCPHVEAAAEFHRARIAPPPSGGRGAATPVDPAAAQRLAEQAMRSDWTRAEATAAEARVRHAAAPSEDSYSDNFAAFEADHAAALARKAAGEPVIPLMVENALGGEFTRGSGRGFGVELEFDFPSGVNKSDALRAIGRDLFDAGLTQTASQQRYHAAASRGYVDVHEQGWSFEQDCTVAGEIVSPIMYDEPKTWETIDKICQIVKAHGGVANAKTGSHVHVSAPNMTTRTASEIMQLANGHEDVMYRISQNPERPTHRPMQWCGPNNDVPQGGYADITDVSRISSHNRSINFGGVQGRQSDHPEIRHWDGTLDAAAIQAQVKVSCGLILAGERNAGQSHPTAVREPVGSHVTRLAAVRGRSRRALTSEELADDTTTFRSFVDTLFTRREDKAQATALFSVTNWQRAT